ncbi:hypothetical protein Q0M94_02060 [Deinococcus radiomollis]|uniref:hypothetical protein n=1 Tax=Deinococcus radiomollis TaxID=468916 RepID=UPI0038921BBF
MPESYEIGANSPYLSPTTGASSVSLRTEITICFLLFWKPNPLFSPTLGRSNSFRPRDTISSAAFQVGSGAVDFAVFRRFDLRGQFPEGRFALRRQADGVAELSVGEASRPDRRGPCNGKAGACSRDKEGTRQFVSRDSLNAAL